MVKKTEVVSLGWGNLAKTNNRRRKTGTRGTYKAKCATSKATQGGGTSQGEHQNNEVRSIAVLGGEKG